MSLKALLTLSASVLLGAAAFAPSAALAQLPGPPPGPPPMLAGPPQGLGAGGPLARPVAAFRRAVPRALLRATSRVVRLASMVLRDCMVSIAAARPIFAVSKLAPRLTAPTATPAVTPATAMATGTATDTGRMRRRLLMPMVDPTPPLTAATTSPPIGDPATGGFLSVIETDWGGRPDGAPTLHRGVCFLAETQLASQSGFRT
jgi:hypothetical protein